jgi:hypothetical protein
MLGHTPALLKVFLNVWQPCHRLKQTYVTRKKFIKLQALTLRFYIIILCKSYLNQMVLLKILCLSNFCFVFCLFIYFEIGSNCIGQGLPHTCDPPASASQAMGLQTCTIIPGFVAENS